MLSSHICAYCLQLDTRRTPAPQVSVKSQDALGRSYHTARHECHVNRARAEGDTEVHFYHGEYQFHATWPYIYRALWFETCHVHPCSSLCRQLLSAPFSDLNTLQKCSCQGQQLHPSAHDEGGPNQATRSKGADSWARGYNCNNTKVSCIRCWKCCLFVIEGSAPQYMYCLSDCISVSIQSYWT